MNCFSALVSEYKFASRSFQDQTTEWHFLGNLHSVSVFLQDCPLGSWSWRMVSGITAWRVQWTRLPHSPKTDSDRLIKDNCGRYCPVCSFPSPFQRSTDSNGLDCLWLDDHYRSSDCRGVSSIRLPMLWCCSPSFMISYQVANLARTQLTGDRMQGT